MSVNKVRLRVEVEVYTSGLSCARKCQFLREYPPSCTLFEQTLLVDMAASRPVRLQQCLRAEHWAMGVEPKETSG